MTDMAQAQGRIVVVDDDRLVREIVCDALESLARVPRERSRLLPSWG